MRRKRQQNGYIFKARGHWYVRYFVDRTVNGELRHDRVAKQIGEVATRGKRPPQKIEDEAREIVAAATTTNANPGRVVTMGEFVDRVYFPHVQQHKRPSTLKGYKDIWRNHVESYIALPCGSRTFARLMFKAGWMPSQRPEPLVAIP